MNDTLLLAQHLSSAALVLSSWFLAHQEALRVPPGRVIATACAVVGFTTFAAAIARHWPTSPDTVAWLVVLSKIGITIGFAAAGYRECRGRKTDARVRR